MVSQPNRNPMLFQSLHCTDQHQFTLSPPWQSWMPWNFLMLYPSPWHAALPWQALSSTDLIAHVVAQSHVSIQLATVEQISLGKLQAQSLGFNHVHTADVGNIPKPTETQQKKNETWNTTKIRLDLGDRQHCSISHACLKEPAQDSREKPYS